MIKAFLKDGLVYTISSLFSAGIGIIMIPIYTRIFSPADYGIIDLLTVMNSLAAIIFNLEISQALPRFFNKENNDNSNTEFVTTGLVYTIVSSLLFVLLSVLLSLQFSNMLFHSADNRMLICLSGVSFLFVRVFHYSIIIARNDQKSMVVGILSIISSLITVSLAIILVVYFKKGVAGILTATIISSLLISIPAIYSVRKYISLSFNKERLMKMLVFSLPLAFSALGGLVLNYTDRVVINKLMSLTEVGIYGIASRLSSVTNLVIMGFSTAVVPLVYANSGKSETPKEIVKVFNIYICMMLLMVLTVSLFSGELLILFTQPQYYSSWELIPILVLTNLFASTGYFFPGLFLSGKTKIVAMINIIGALINLGLNFMLIPVIGLIGSAFASMFSTIFVCVIQANLSQSKYYIPYDFKLYVKPFLIVAVGVVTTYFLKISAITIIFKITIILLYITYIYRSKMLDFKVVANYFKSNSRLK